MTDLILHHYDISPYAEKIRLALGLKDLDWKSVHIPIVMPKPDVTELTGGYRRTPVLQIGADIYCDTKACARVLERLHPEPSLFPGGNDAVTWGLSRWAETSFMMAVAIFFGVGGTFDEAFVEDRKKMVPHIDLSQAGRIVAGKLLQLRANLDLLERLLRDGRPFLLGDAPGLADLSAYHPHMMLGVHPTTAALLAPLEWVPAWMRRVAQIGHGRPREIESGEAIHIARDATPAEIEGPFAELPEGLEVGDRVVVLPEEAGSGIVAGELLASGIHEIAVRRESERAGELAVHFPREDYVVVRA